MPSRRGQEFFSRVGISEESIPQGLKPGFVVGFERAKAKALAYPEAEAKADPCGMTN